MPITKTLSIMLPNPVIMRIPRPLKLWILVIEPF